MHIVVFFTFDVSLRVWQETGLLTREMRIYENYANRGHNVSFVTYGNSIDRKYVTVEGVSAFPVYERIRRSSQFRNNLGKSFFVPFFFRHILNKADVFKTNQMSGAWVAVIAKVLFRKPLVVRCGYEMYRNRCVRERTNLLKHMFMFSMSWCSYRLADVILISSKTDANYISKTFRVPHDKIILHRNFIDTKLFSPRSGSMKKGNRLLYVGRLVPRKNLKAVISALKGTQYGIDVVGQGEQREELESLAKRYSVDLRCLGMIPNDQLPITMGHYKVLILPSLFENNPKSLLEAMSCGLAVIGADVDGIRELIIHGENGLLCRTDAISIRTAVQEAMSDDVGCETMGRNARQFILNQCSLESVWRREMAVMDRLARNGA